MRKTFVVLAGVAIVFSAASIAVAGNMAVTVFDSLPEEFEAGRTYTLEYSILQHGVNPVEGANSVLTFTAVDDGETLAFAATETSTPGRYRVDVTLPRNGDWSWQVSQGAFEPHVFGALTVAAASEDGFDLVPWILALAALAAGWFTLQEARSRLTTTHGLRGEPV